MISDASITVISANGAMDLRGHDFRLLYSRRDNGRVVARLVAEKEGKIESQIEPNADGESQGEAFLALRRHVEVQLDQILCHVPGSSVPHQYFDGEEGRQLGGPSRSNTIKSDNGAEATSPRQLTDAPPAYGNAVKEWKTNEKKK